MEMDTVGAEATTVARRAHDAALNCRIVSARREIAFDSTAFFLYFIFYLISLAH